NIVPSGETNRSSTNRSPSDGSKCSNSWAIFTKPYAMAQSVSALISACTASKSGITSTCPSAVNVTGSMNDTVPATLLPTSSTSRISFGSVVAPVPLESAGLDVVVPPSSDEAAGEPEDAAQAIPNNATTQLRSDRPCFMRTPDTESYNATPPSST